MHPKIIFPGELQPLFDDLKRPLHDRSRRNRKRYVQPGEISLEDGYRLEIDVFADSEHRDFLLADFRRFMAITMEVPETFAGLPIRLVEGNPPGEGPERYAICLETAGCTVTAASLDGLRRALFSLEDEMLRRRAPHLPLGIQHRQTQIATRIIRSPLAPYRWLSGWELEDENDYYPEEYLNRLAHDGINGIWVAGLFRNLIASKVIPEIGPASHRLDKLKGLVEKAARHGIRVYFFCMEPRALTPDHPAVSLRPEILGARRSLCTSAPLVLDYLRDAAATLFAEVPGLAGMINIFCGERPTSCWWLDEVYAHECPRCRERPKAEVLAETLNACVDGARSSNPDAEFMAWTYMIGRDKDSLPIAPMLEVVRRTRPEVIWLGNFEHGAVKQLCGRDVQIHEYSLSCIGPSENFRDLARETSAIGRRIYAKLQVGTTYELSSVPYLPVPGIVYEKLAAAAELGAAGSMLSWIPGGAPSPMLKAAGEAAFELKTGKEAFLTRLAALTWGEHAAPSVVAAWSHFEKAWQQYPFHVAVLYYGPITRCPSYHLHLEREPRLAKPYNWGYTRKREPQPFEDQYERWLGFYTVEEITGSFRKMAQLWLEGLQLLQAAATQNDDLEIQRQLAVASAIRIQCLSAANVYEFYALRDRLSKESGEAQSAILKQMHSVAQDDIALATAMKKEMAIEPFLGFEPELYAFSYSVSLLDQKILQVRGMLRTLEAWQRNGIDHAVLTQTVEEAEALKPDRNPDYWGD